MIGYAIYTAGKPVAKRVMLSRVAGKGKGKGKGKGTGMSGKRRVAIVSAAVGAVGAVAIWRRRRSKPDQFDQYDQSPPLES